MRDRLRQQPTRIRREDAGLGNHCDDGRREIVGDAGDVPLPREAHAAGERGGEVVGVALEVEAGLEQLVGGRVDAGRERSGDETERDSGRARTEPALARDPLDERERAALRRREARERLHDEVALVHVAVALADLDLVPEIERDARDVEAWAEIGRRCRSSDPHAASLSVASGSLSPCPVRTQTTDWPTAVTLAATAAMPAAEAGSQNTPSSRATSRHASSSWSSDSVHERSAGALQHAADLEPVHGLDDADRGRERVLATVGLAEHEARQPLAEADRIRDRVSAATVREREDVGNATELLHHLARGGGLPFDAIGVDRIDVDEAFLVRESARFAMRVLERSVDLTHVRAHGARLGDLAASDGAARGEDDRAHSCSRRIRGRRRSRVPRGSAHDAGCAALDRARDGDRHAAVLERAGRVRALPLEPQLDAKALREPGRLQERRVSLAEGDHSPRSAITGRTKGGRSTSGNAAISRSAADTSPKGAR